MVPRSSRLAGLVALIPCLAHGATVKLPQIASVARIVDGDTVVVKDSSGEYTARLIGIDAPEGHPCARLDADAALSKQDKETILALGRKAADFTKTLCLGRVCRLEYDSAHADKGYRDPYGRILVYLWIKDPRGKPLLANAEIIRQGYARAITDLAFDKDYKDSFVRLQQDARLARRGIWAAGGEVPWPRLSEGAIIGNKNSKKYHKPTCSAVERMSPDNRVEFQSADEAKAQGYQPCKLCNP